MGHCVGPHPWDDVTVNIQRYFHRTVPHLLLNHFRVCPSLEGEGSEGVASLFQFPTWHVCSTTRPVEGCLHHVAVERPTVSAREYKILVSPCHARGTLPL